MVTEFRLLWFFLIATAICQAQTQREQSLASANVVANPEQEHASKANQKTSSLNPFQTFQQFSATLNGGLANDHDRKIYRSGDLLRADFDGSYRVTNLKARTMCGVDSGECMQIALPDASSYPFSYFAKSSPIERELTSESEVVDGYHCKIENLTFRPDDGRPDVKMKLWEAEDLQDFPIQIEVTTTTRRIAIHYSNVSLDAPDPKLFRHPPHCRVGPTPGQKGALTFSLPTTSPIGSPKANPSSNPSPDSEKQN
jgi:hypothetical protein